MWRLAESVSVHCAGGWVPMRQAHRTGSGCHPDMRVRKRTVVLPATVGEV